TVHFNSGTVLQRYPRGHFGGNSRCYLCQQDFEQTEIRVRSEGRENKSCENEKSTCAFTESMMVFLAEQAVLARIADPMIGGFTRAIDLCVRRWIAPALWCWLFGLIASSFAFGAEAAEAPGVTSGNTWLTFGLDRIGILQKQVMGNPIW